jgi:hypothetical protein
MLKNQSEVLNYNNSVLNRDMWDLMCSDMIGQGCSRKVFLSKLDSSLVIKVEEAGRSFNNIREWELWEDVRHDKNAARWLAPCVNISLCGTILIQKRTEPAHKRRFPKVLPRWIATDLKYQNWGLLDGKIVCHDYASHLAQRYGTMSKSTVKAHWWVGSTLVA